MHGCKMLKNSNGTGGNSERTCMTIHKGHTAGPQGAVVNRFGGYNLIIAIGQYKAYPYRKHPPDFPKKSISFPGSSSFIFCLICHSLFFHNRGDYPIPIQSSQRVELSIRAKSISPRIMPYTRRKIKRARKSVNPSFRKKCVFITSSPLFELCKYNAGIV